MLHSQSAAESSNLLHICNNRLQCHKDLVRINYLSNAEKRITDFFISDASSNLFSLG